MKRGDQSVTPCSHWMMAPLLLLILWRNVHEILLPPLAYQQNKLDENNEENPTDQDEIRLDKIDDGRILHGEFALSQ